MRASASVVHRSAKGVGESVAVGGEPGSAPVELGHAAGRLDHLVEGHVAFVEAALQELTWPLLSEVLAAETLSPVGPPPVG